MKTGEEIKVEIEQGKMLVIKLLQIGEANEDGIRTIFFEFNGLPREIDIKDETTIAAPISGIVSQIHVAAGSRIESGDCLMEIEIKA